MTSLAERFAKEMNIPLTQSGTSQTILDTDVVDRVLYINGFHKEGQKSLIYFILRERVCVLLAK